ncbi:hypothetical protein MUK42_17031 [Musa troglodytarum]|uniref:Uncharacterized protein n=1 Tax=Musa troglodytarum TaxID=320322 RepID=A0A9E7H4Z1_9LILI|nr:hypothetical protein MUK42_17031 [Musa troglodytarum]
MLHVWIYAAMLRLPSLSQYCLGQTTESIETEDPMTMTKMLTAESSRITLQRTTVLTLEATKPDTAVVGYITGEYDQSEANHGKDHFIGYHCLGGGLIHGIQAFRVHMLVAVTELLISHLSTGILFDKRASQGLLIESPCAVISKSIPLTVTLA